MKSFFKRLGDIWLIFGVTLLILILIELFFRGWFYFKSEEDPRIQADCYQNSEWVVELYKEFKACKVEQWQSYVYWRHQPFIGKYVNIHHSGLRKTIYPISDTIFDNPVIKIFFFGGSTMWGSGVRDNYTIPSLVGLGLSELGYNVDIMNYGESGYVNTQEMISLILQLQKKNIPNIAIFYNGVNDTYSAYQQGIAGIPQNEFNRVREFNILKGNKIVASYHFRSLFKLSTVRFALENFTKKKKSVNYYGKEEIDSLSTDIIDIYSQNVRNLKSLASEYGFKIMFYWQPTIFHKRKLSSYEQQQYEENKPLKEFVFETIHNIDTSSTLKASKNFYNIHDILYELQEPTYIDWCHIGENGNIIIARRMIQDVIPLVDSILEISNKKIE